jgi:predicted metalloprotease
MMYRISRIFLIRPAIFLAAALLAAAIAPAATAGATSAAAAASVTAAAAAAAAAPVDGELVGRERALFAHANDFWSRQIAALGGHYLPAKLKLFSDRASNVCGTRITFTGPFYCPSELTVYLDQGYVQALKRRAAAGGFDTALAVVIGYGLARHIQTIVGTTFLVQQARARSTAQLSRQTWITAALQAGCYAGLWARAAQKDGTIKAGGDISAALATVAAVSHQRDTHLSAGEQMPDPIMDYATPAQRLKWFQQGLDSGNFNDCDTFDARAEVTP